MGLIFIRLACFLGFATVALGAFGAHALKDRLSGEMLAIFETGVKYQMYHTLALLGFGLFKMLKVHASNWPGYLFVAGIVIFSGSLYALALTGIKKWGMVTPIGGMLFIMAWFLWFASTFNGAKN